jgi:hypothetical protein
MIALHLGPAALAGAARAASVLTHEMADRVSCGLDSEICNSDSWENGVPPTLEMSLEEAQDIAKNLRRIADLLERIGRASA